MRDALRSRTCALLLSPNANDLPIRGNRAMKKLLWILFVVAALIWTAMAFAAAGLARWTADVVASPPATVATNASTASTASTMVQTTQKTPVADGASAAGARQVNLGEVASQQVTTTSKSTTTTTDLPPTPLPALPPMPAWVNEWLGAEWVTAIKEWTAWAQYASGISADAAQHAAAKAATDAIAAASAATSAASVAAASAADSAASAQLR